MLRIMLPRASLLVEVRLVVVVLVVIVYVLVVDVDIAVAPSAAPAATPRGSERDAGPERNRRSRRVIPWGRIVNRRIRINGRTIDDGWVVRGDVNHFGVGLLNHDNLFTPLHCLSLNFLLCAGF